MIHFNELYITEDGKHLVIDVELDTTSTNDGCYLDEIIVDVASNSGIKPRCDKLFKNPVTVWHTQLIGDLDNDGEITDNDMSLFNGLYDEIRDAILTGAGVDPTLKAKLDINFDGELNVNDLDDVLTVYQDHKIIPIKERHKRLCLTVGDEELARLGIARGKLDGLFFVKVTAGCDVETMVNTDCGCQQNEIVGAAYNGKPLYDAAVRYAASYGDSCDNNDASRFMDFILRYYAFIYALKCGDIKQACRYWTEYLQNNTVKTSFAGGGCGCHGAYR